MGKEQYSQPLMIGNAYKRKNSMTNLIKPWKLKLEDLEFINCPLATVIEKETVQEAEIAASSALKFIVEQVAKEYDKNNVQICAITLFNMSKGSVPNSDKSLNLLKSPLREFYLENICVNEENIVNICMQTVDQSTSSTWFDQRNLRISASSRAHKIKTRPKKGYTELSLKFCSERREFTTPALKYGLKNEKRAAQSYLNEYGGEIIPLGLMIMPDKPFLCASPDGIIVNDGCVSAILEIKCPYSCANKPIYDQETQKFNVPYLFKENGVSHLSSSHQYYTQCQMLMAVCGLHACHLYVWSPVINGSELVVIQRDEPFLDDLLPKLENFYFNYYLDVLYKLQKSEKENQSIKINQSPNLF